MEKENNKLLQILKKLGSKKNHTKKMSNTEFKTLIGKNNYLFLQNDSYRESEVHNDNLDLIKSDFSVKPPKYFDRYLLIVFPDKSLICKEHLPDGYNMKYRPGMETYKKHLKDQIFDLYPYLTNDDVYYKTDVHMNLNGMAIAYRAIIDKLNELFGLKLEKMPIRLEKKECVLMDLNIGAGDLTWEMNLGNQHLDSRLDNYYYSEDIASIYCSYKIAPENIYNLTAFNFELEDETKLNDGALIDWYFLSKYIIKTKNENATNKTRVVIFYDSFLTSTLELWMKTFYEVYFIKIPIPKYLFSNKNNLEIIDKIKPDYVLEFRVEGCLV